MWVTLSLEDVSEDELIKLGSYGAKGSFNSFCKQTDSQSHQKLFQSYPQMLPLLYFQEHIPRMITPRVS